MEPDEDYWEDNAWDGEPTPRAFCDVYDVHEPHWYRALNRNDYSCPGLTVAELAEIERIENEPLCEHQLSARQCGGPMHWYDESNRHHLGM